MTLAQAATIREAIAARLNIVICGGTSSGKTTLANAVIAEIVAAAPQDRIVILKDTAEIQCAAENAVALNTSDAAPRSTKKAMPHDISRTATLGLFTAVLCLALSSPALKSSDGGLPWEDPLQQIQESITGPVAGFIALAAVAIAEGCSSLAES